MRIIDKFSCVRKPLTTSVVRGGITTKNEALKYLQVCVRNVNAPRKSEQELTRPCYLPDLEVCIRWCKEEKGAGLYVGYYVDPEFLNAVGISEEEAWTAAFWNTRKEKTLTTLPGMIMQLMEETEEELPEDVKDREGMPIYVLTNERNYMGAGEIASAESMAETMEEIGCSACYILPSSIHEVILVPIMGSDHFDKEKLDRMVTEVNQTMVDPKDQLSDHAYKICHTGDRKGVQLLM